ncbi:hypothetical protein C8J56DRAFT_773858 [Mycena floridula]|nr:hypothetical protein C8J56DRAFT_773858 [Mycena floridula]
MIARCRSKCWVVQLKEDNNKAALANAQRGMHGHIIIYLQKPSCVAQQLPPALEEITAPICVLFVGATKPTEEWLRTKASPLAVRGWKVREALKWLIKHNHLYKDVTLNHKELARLEDNPILPFHIEHVIPNDAIDSSTDGYAETRPSAIDVNSSETVTFQNVVITDVQGDASYNQLRSAAVRHVKNKLGGYVQVAHDPEPVNEFFNPDLLPMVYPTLFPYGVGGVEDKCREERVAM